MKQIEQMAIIVKKGKGAEDNLNKALTKATREGYQLITVTETAKQYTLFVMRVRIVKKSEFEF